MNPIVAKDIIETLDKVLKALRDKDFAAISELSNHVIHDASIFQDDDSVSFAILVYAVSKIIQRCVDTGVCFDKFESVLQDAFALLKAGDFGAYASKIHNIFKLIQSADDKLKLYVEEVIHKAKIKKGSKMYEHGISVARTAEILGISQWELMNYLGKTRIGEVVYDEDARKRVAVARRLFSR